MAPNAFSVIAMKGSAYGTSNSGSPASRAASTSASGTSLCPKPVPNPTPATWRDASRSTYALCTASSPSWRPVVRISSPPDSHGVGSSSSVGCTQRIGASAASPPTSSSSCMSSTRPWTVSMSVLDDPVPRLGEDGAQDPVDLLERGGVRDQRRRQLDHRVAAVVCAADQAVLVEGARQEAAQQRLGLLVAE